MPEPLTQLALVALGEVAPAEQIGELVSTSEPNEEGVRTLRFASDVPGHPDWFWTVWTTQVEDDEPTVLECDLLPGEDALLAPAWIPWAERLAEFRATHDRNGKLVDEDDELDDEGEAPEVEEAEAESDAPRSTRGKSSTRTQRRTRRRRRRRSS
ncbi:DUF3027 domain-containing protein [Gulosibacter sp. ACHW.36C]|uniref:DUF3027 domain-containing protein n=1 Tax=Gulosibacter sediminis TaxID=1729695 RepID=A0ABY4MZS9_9MICO|nr:DUF3027 domain-containing protein [Gulosibacter sediminis]UQN15567.1 DUF3027 domain-containing protein [Gulosibacter sediminis]